MKAEAWQVLDGVEVAEGKVDGMPPLPGTATSQTSAVIDRAEIVAEVVADIQKQLTMVQGEVTEKAFAYADKLARDAIKTLREELAKVERPRPQILSVNVNGVTRKLSQQAHKDLGRLLAVLQALPANKRNIFLYGPMGCGKTTIAAQIAESLGCEFSADLITAGASESWITGRYNPKTGDYIASNFIKRFSTGGVWFWDETTATDPNLAMLVNQGLDNGFFSYAGTTYKRHPDFICIAADNTVGLGGTMQFTGRNRLDASTRQRFSYWREVDYDANIETQLCPQKPLREALWALRQDLRKRNAPVGITTRDLERCSVMTESLGFEWADLVKEVFGAGWSAEFVAVAMSHDPAKQTKAPEVSAMQDTTDKTIF